MNSLETVTRLGRPVGAPVRDPLDKLFTRISEISSLPRVAQRIVQLASDDNATVDDLRRVIQTDPALTAKLLRLVNSSFYAIKNSVRDLRTAISLLGFHEVRNLALSIFVAEQFQKSGDHNAYTRIGLWKHSQAVALMAQRIARVSGRGKPGEIFLAGLLHDIGYILLDQHLRRHFCEVLDEINEDTATCVVERRLLSFDHARLGASVAAKWKFPTQIVDAIRYHHSPETYRGEFVDAVRAVAIANHMATRAGCSALGVANVEPPADGVYAQAGLDPATQEILWNDMTAILSDVDDVL